MCCHGGGHVEWVSRSEEFRGSDGGMGGRMGAATDGRGGNQMRARCPAELGVDRSAEEERIHFQPFIRLLLLAGAQDSHLD